MLARGLVFACPRCGNDAKKAHFCIFLLEHQDTPETMKPLGRFFPSMKNIPERAELDDFGHLSLWPADAPSNSALKPADVCGWQGWLKDGVVYWRPRILEQLIARLAH
jgi:hypothetical protein